MGKLEHPWVFAEQYISGETGVGLLQTGRPMTTYDRRRFGAADNRHDCDTFAKDLNKLVTTPELNDVAAHYC
jgi:hypothetical protein